MKCPNCGLETNGNFCAKCGYKLNPYTRPNQQYPFPPQYTPQPQNNNSTQKSNGLKVFLIIIAIAIPIIIGAIIVNNLNPNNKDGNPVLLTRSANNSDVHFNTDYNFTLSISCKVTPNIDIKNLQLTFTFTNGSGNAITTKTKTLGNVSKNTEYSVSFGLSEFGLTDLLVMAGYTVGVTGGTVSYFA